MFKITTIIFMALCAVFAGLYYTEAQITEQSIMYIEVPSEATGGAYKETILVKNSIKTDSTRSQTNYQSKPRVIIREVNPFEDVDKEDADFLLNFQKIQRREQGRVYKNENSLLFQRLELDETSEGAFLELMADRELAKEIRPHGWMTQEEKEEAGIKRREVIESLELKVEEVLGPQYETFIKYREKAGHYRMIAEMDKRLSKENFNLDLEQQDQLASILQNGKKNASRFNWKKVRKNPELKDDWKALVKENQNVMAAQAGEFLEGPQLKVLQEALKSHYSNLEISYQLKKKPRN